MQKLEVIIEENAHGSIRPVEIVADAQVSALVPALVEELKLPQTDLFGKPLVYMLRYAPNGRILSEQSTLLASGVTQGTRLMLDSFVIDGSVATLLQRTQEPSAADPLFHSSDTASDGARFSGVAGMSKSAQRNKKVARRTFLAIGSVVLGAGTVGVGYAAFRKFNNATLNTANMMGARQTKVQKAANTTTPMIPTMAKVGIVFTGHQQTVRTVAWSPDGTMLASGADDTQLLLWGNDGTVHLTIAHPTSIRAIAWSPDSQRLVTGANNQVFFLNAKTGAPLLRAIRPHTGAIGSLAWATNGQQVVSGGADNLAVVWNATAYRSQTLFAHHTSPITSVSWAADGQTIASASQGGAVRVWNATSGQEIHAPYENAKIPIRVLAFSPVGTMLAVGGDDGSVRFWNGMTCQQQAVVKGIRQCVDMSQQLQAARVPIRSLAWSPDGKYLAVGSNDGVFSLWSPAQLQKPLLTMTMQQNTPVHSITWAPKGNQLAVSAGNKVSLLSLS